MAKDHYCHIEEVDERLSGSVAGAVIAEFDDSGYDAKPAEPSPAEAWASRACWERSKFGGGGVQWAAIAEGARARAAIRFFVDRYFEANNELPIGRHHVRVSLGSLEDGVDCAAPRLSSQPAVFERDVLFPES